MKVLEDSVDTMLYRCIIDSIELSAALGLGLMPQQLYPHQGGTIYLTYDRLLGAGQNTGQALICLCPQSLAVS